MLLLKIIFPELEDEGKLVYNLTDKGFESLDANGKNEELEKRLILNDSKMKSKIIEDVNLKGEALITVKLFDNGKKITAFTHYSRVKMP